MKAFKRLPLLALLCLTAVGTTLADSAIAGSTTTAGADAEPSSSIGVDFAPPVVTGGNGGGGGAVGASTAPGGSATATAAAINASPAAAAAVTNSVSSSTNSISGGATLASPGGPVSVSAAAASVIEQAVNSTDGGSADGGADSESAEEKNLSQLKQDGDAEIRSVLEQQISDELASFGVAMDVSDLANSLTGLSSSPEQLPAAVEAMNDLVMSASRAELEALASSPSITAIRQILTAGNSVL